MEDTKTAAAWYDQFHTTDNIVLYDPEVQTQRQFQNEWNYKLITKKEYIDKFYKCVIIDNN